jgi:hypothetical protein
MKNIFYYILIVIIITELSFSQIKLSDLNTLNIQDVAEMFVGNNESVRNVKYTGSNNSCGIFKGAINTGIGIDSGIILTTGSINNIKGPNKSFSTTTRNFTKGDTTLSGLVNFGTKDAAVLEFDFLPKTGIVSFLYVFASEEYNEYVDSAYNDIFAFLIDGKNIAFLPNSNITVAINNVNNKRNSAWFIDNTTGKYNIECDGFTKVLEAKTDLEANKWHHIKIAIADVADDLYDSWIFLQANSFRTIPKYKLTTSVYPDGGGTISGNSGAQTYDEGTNITLKATPSSCFVFKKWEGSISSDNPEIKVTMDADKTIIADFERGIYDCMKEVYENNFEVSAGPEFSSSKISKTPTGKRGFLGEFSNDIINLSLNNLPEHQLVKVSFDLYILRSWDGNDIYSHADSAVVGPDIWSLKVDGTTDIFKTTFSNWPQSKQAYPNEYPNNSFNFRTLAVENNSLGYTIDFYDKRLMDAVYHLEFIFKHSKSSIILSFLANGLQSIDDESWGIDNMHVYTICECNPPIILSKNILNFTAKQNGELPASQNIEVNNIGSGALNWKAYNNQKWLEISPSTGTNDGQIIAKTNTTNLPIRVYYDTIYIIDSIASNSPQKRLVVYNIESGASIKIQFPDTLISGNSIDIPLKTEDLTGKNVNFFKFSFNYNNSLLKLQKTAITDGTLCLEKDWIIYLEDDLKGNTIVIGYGTTPLKGAGNLLKLKFDIIDRNFSEVPLILNYFTFNDGDPIAITQNGKIKINSLNSIVSKNIINSYSLSQNYPNPFNPETKIEYSLQYDGNIKIIIYDIHGKEIEKLIDKYMPSGNYSILWKPVNLPSGVYYYKMQAGQFTESRKMIYLR